MSRGLSATASTETVPSPSTSPGSGGAFSSRIRAARICSRYATRLRGNLVAPLERKTAGRGTTRLRILQPGRGECGGEVRILDDAGDTAVVHGHDRRIAADEERAAGLEWPLVARVELDSGEAHADDDVLADADAAVDGNLVLLGDPVAQDAEDVGAVGDPCGFPDADPLDLGVEHLFDRVQIAGDEGAVPPQQQVDPCLAHAASVPSGTSAAACP